jgi:hypothetical protein
LGCVDAHTQIQTHHIHTVFAPYIHPHVVSLRCVTTPSQSPLYHTVLDIIGTVLFSLSAALHTRGSRSGMVLTEATRQITASLSRESRTPSGSGAGDKSPRPTLEIANGTGALGAYLTLVTVCHGKFRVFGLAVNCAYCPSTAQPLVGTFRSSQRIDYRVLYSMVHPL